MQPPNTSNETLAPLLAHFLPAIQEVIMDAAGYAAVDAKQGDNLFLIDQYADEAVRLLSDFFAAARAAQITTEHAETFWNTTSLNPHCQSAKRKNGSIV